MRKFGWYAVGALVLGVMLGGGVLLAANLYVQSQRVQLRIRQALASTLRMPVSIKKTTITPWEGLRIDGIDAQAETEASKPRGKTADSISVASFRVRFALGPLLLRKQLVVSEVLLDRPKVAWAQDSVGRWQFPAEDEGNLRKKSRPKSPLASASESSPGELASATTPPTESPVNDVSPPPPAITSQPNLEAAPAPRPPARKLDNFVLTVGKFRLRHGNLEFLNKKRGLIGRFDEVNLDGHLSNPTHADGTVSVNTATLPRYGLKLRDFSSNFVYDHQDGLDLNAGRAELAGGLIRADYHLRTGEPDSPFSLQCRMDNVSIGQLIKEAGSRMALAEGRLQGDLSVTGRSDDPDSRIATGKFQLIDAQVHGFPLFQMVGDALHIADLSHMQFKKAQLDYTVEGTSLNVNPLLLVSNDLQIRAQGRYQTEEDRLDLHARLILDAAISKQLPRFVNEKFTRDNDENPGSQYIDFNVTGPLSKPTTNLYKQMLPNDVGSLLQGLLGSKPKKNKPFRQPDPAPAPATPDGQ